MSGFNGDLVSIAKNDADILNKEENNEAAGAGASYSRALVPTVDIYTARLFFNFTRNIVEETVDRRVSLLEEKIKDRDQELMRAIRKLQARLGDAATKQSCSVAVVEEVI